MKATHARRRGAARVSRLASVETPDSSGACHATRQPLAAAQAHASGVLRAQAVVDRYCVTCHNARMRDRRSRARRARRGAGRPRAADVGEGGAQGAHRHDAAGRRAAAGPRHARRASRRPSRPRSIAPPPRAPNPGAPALHRLNRTEYGNAVRDLLDLPIDAAALLPGDDSSEGFDNMASVLSVSPALMQAYVSAAAKISRLAVGDPTISADVTTYLPPRGMSQAGHREGLPLGTRGGLLVQHVFPLDAEYEFRVGRAGGGLFGLPPVGADDEVEITLERRARAAARTRRAARRHPAEDSGRARRRSASPSSAAPTRVAWTICSPSSPIPPACRAWRSTDR